ncbi:MAG: electron transfer flavoprotein subunit alpha/FixB family protein [Spirochaetes bacterium]|nr:electron transfer flavoprotein subunit alpha/FixB family protein [Spirochaetota bacterium]
MRNISNSILIFAEWEEQLHYFKQVVYEIGIKSCQLANVFPGQVNLVVLGGNLPKDKKTLAFADRIYHYPAAELKHFDVRTYTQVISQLIKEIKPNIVLLGATPLGRILAPRIASRLEVGLTADCTALEIDNTGLLQQIRPAFGGNIMATIVAKKTRPQMATVRPHVFSKDFAADLVCKKNPTIIKKRLIFPLETQAVKIIQTMVNDTKLVNIEEAKILVSFGKGIGKKENIKKIYQLAEQLKAQVSCSRAIVEAGWMNHAYQVGQSGKIVSPDLYIAIGISGAVQHLVGIRSSKKIVAINIDKEAPIFQLADLGIVGDYEEVLPELLNSLIS